MTGSAAPPRTPPVGTAREGCALQYALCQAPLPTLPLPRFGPQALCGIKRRDHDVLVAGIAAQVARNGDADFPLGRVRIVAQEFQERGQYARRAEAALHAVILMKGLLQRMQLVGARCDAFDGEKVVAVRLDGEHQARPHRTAVHQDRAGAAYTVLAAQMRAGEAELMADKIRERDPNLDFFLVALAVDRQGDLARFTHVRSLCVAGRTGICLFQRAP